MFLGSAVAQNENVEEALNSLPPELQGKITEEQVNVARNQSLEVFKQMCEKHGGNDAYDTVLVSLCKLFTFTYSFFSSYSANMRPVLRP